MIASVIGTLVMKHGKSIFMKDYAKLARPAPSSPITDGVEPATMRQIPWGGAIGTPRAAHAPTNRPMRILHRIPRRR